MPGASRAAVAPSIAVALSGAMWGLYWLPLRHLQSLGLPGEWATAGFFAASLPFIVPIAFVARHELRAHGGSVAGLAVANGLVFGLYSNAYVHTSVFNVLFLFYLSPVWSVLIARFMQGERVGAVRMACVVLGLAGLTLMLSADGGWPVPRNIGDWMSLISGILWAFVSIRIRRNQHIGAAANTVAFFLGGIGPALLVAFAAAGAPPLAAIPAALPVLIGVAALGWVPSQVMLFWGVRRISPVRTGILLMAELISGAVSAAWLSGDPVTWPQVLGGVMILAAGLGDVVTAREGPVPTPVPAASAD